MVSFLLQCSTTWLSLIAVWFVLGATHWDQPWTPALTLPHVCDGLSVRLMAVCCPFRMPSSCRQGHRQFMRNALRDLTTIVPATACDQRNYVETYSRSISSVIKCILSIMQNVITQRNPIPAKWRNHTLTQSLMHGTKKREKCNGPGKGPIMSYKSEP